MLELTKYTDVVVCYGSYDETSERMKVKISPIIYFRDKAIMFVSHFIEFGYYHTVNDVHDVSEAKEILEDYSKRFMAVEVFNPDVKCIGYKNRPMWTIDYSHVFGAIVSRHMTKTSSIAESFSKVMYKVNIEPCRDNIEYSTPDFKGRYIAYYNNRNRMFNMINIGHVNHTILANEGWED